MKVKVISPIRTGAVRDKSPGVVHEAGAVVELDDAEAKSLLELGRVQALEAPKK